MFRTLLLITAAGFAKSSIPSVLDPVIMAKSLPKTMRAVGIYKYLPLSDPDCLVDINVPVPTIQKSEVLVEVKATSVNPIDTKIRAPNAFKPNLDSSPRILGWDGAGVVVDRGETSKFFNIGDDVFFTGDLRKNGTDAQYVALDEIHLAKKPKNFTFEQAAAMPLTSVTAYESLYDRLLLSEKDKGKSILIINSAGGVGSVATQLAKNLGLTVIGTASRPETENFTREHGADIVLDHSKDLIPQLEACGYENGVDFILVNYDPFPYWDTLMRAIKAQGKICLIVDSSGLVDIRPLKDKSVTLVSEMMSTRMKYDTEDKYRHCDILTELSRMFEENKLKCTLTKTLYPINAANVKEAHRLIEEKRVIGKIVLSGFQ